MAINQYAKRHPAKYVNGLDVFTFIITLGRTCEEEGKRFPIGAKAL
jgi:hypothetical protein